MAAAFSEKDRFRAALEVCSAVLHHPDPPIEWVHAGQMASTAGFTDWRLEDVDDDDPDLTALVRRNLAADRT